MSRITAALALVPLGVGVSSGVASAATIDVVAGSAASLRAAVSSASNGDIVSIPAGQYVLPCPDAEEQGNVSGDLDIVNKSITLRGPASGTATIEPASGCQERVIDIIDFSAPADTVTIERLTITGGRPSTTGGGVNASFAQATSVIIRDSIITDNIAGDAGAFDAPSGGGVFVQNSGSLLIERSTISNNRVGRGGTGVRGYKAGGGGVAFRGFSTAPGPVTIADSTISDNVGGLAARGGGGGLWLDALDITLTDVDVIDNSLPGGAVAAGNGAGIAIEPLQPADIDVDITVSGGTISGNTIGTPVGGNVTGGHGGGLYLVADGGALDVAGTRFVGNRAGGASGTFAGGSGGNLYASAATSSSIDPLAVTLTDADVIDGRAGASPGGPGGNGGGVYVIAGSFDLGSTISVTRTTFDGNRAAAGAPGGAGGGLYARSTTSNVPGRIQVTDSTFEGNDAGDGRTGVGGDGGAGGGAWTYVDGNNGVKPAVAVTGTTFGSNTAGSGGTNAAGQGGFAGSGGGLLVQADSSSISGSSFVGNHSGTGGTGSSSGRNGGEGGGLYASGGETTVATSTFTSNRTGNGGQGSGTFGASGGSGGGAHLRASRTTNVTDSTFTANATGNGANGPSGGGAGGEGGGLAADLQDGGALQVTEVTVTGNSTGDGGDASAGGAGAGGAGGGIAVRADSGDTTFTQVELAGNSTGDGGTGVTAVSATGGVGAGLFALTTGTSDVFTMSGTVIAGNTAGRGGTATGGGNPGALGGQGAGIWASIGSQPAQNGQMSISTSSITGNATGGGGSGGSGGLSPTGGYGGGAFLAAGPGANGLIEVENSTVADNSTGAQAGGGSRGDGAGLYVHTPTKRVALDHVTLTGNRGRNGDNFMLTSAAGRADITRSVIGAPDADANNSGENCNNATGGPIVSGGYNLEADGTSCNFGSATDVDDIDVPVLGPLQDNGGPGLSRLPVLLGPGAPLVLDRIPAGSCSVSTDQIGASRPVGAGCEPGAVEADPAPVVAVDDVLRVGGGTTTLDLLGNDDLAGFAETDARVEIIDQNSADDIFLENGRWRFRSPQEAGAYTSFTYEACLGTTDQFCDTAVATLIPEGTSRFVALSPNRLFDTRPGEPAAGPKGIVRGGTAIDVQITGVAGVPTSGVSAVAMNVTATQVEGPGFVTAHPTGTQRPLSSNLNFTTPGDTVPNFVVVPVGAGGKVTLYTLSDTHLLADVAGYFTEGGIGTNAADPGSTSGRLISLTPSRVFDTRPTEAASGPKGLVGAGSTIDVQIAGRSGVPTSGVSAVVMNLTATETQAPGFVTAFPKGSSRPTASNLNITGSGQTAPNLVIVPLGADGKISLYTLSPLHLLGDVTGYFTTSAAQRSLSGLFAPSSPRRAFDSREGELPPGSKGYFDDGETRSVRFTANAGVPAAGAGAVMLNATATGAAAPGFVTAWPKGPPRPTASTLNLSFAGQTRPNAAVLPIGDGGSIDFYSLRGVDLLADVFGWFLE